MSVALSRRLLLPLITLALLCAASIFSASRAFAACTPAANDIISPSCFEGGDGNLVVDNANGTGRIDWASLTPSTFTDGTGATDSQFAGGAAGKQNDPGAWSLIEGPNPAKTDVLAVATKTDPVSNHIFFYGAFHRFGDTGNANVSFELNKVATLYDNDGSAATPPVPFRSEGDAMITFDGGAGNVRVGMCLWHGDERGESSNAAYGWYTLPGFGMPGAVKVDSNTDCTTLSTVDLATRVAFGNVNASTLDNTPGGGPTVLSNFPDSIGANTFGEVSVDLTAALSTPGQQNPCFDFGGVWMHSRSSDTIVANMQDYVTPHALVGARSCAISVDKQVAVGSAAGPYHQGTPADPSWANNGDTLYYTLAVRNDGAVPVVVDSIADPNCSAATIADADKRNSANALDATPTSFDPGDVWTYRCSHVLAPGDPEPYVNTVTVNAHVGSAPGPVKSLTATDSVGTGRYGRIVLRKDNVGGTATDDFTFTPSSALSAGGNFLWGESDGDKVFADLLPNDSSATEYSLTEPAAGQPADYSLTGIGCRRGPGADDTVDSDTTVSLAARKATVEVSAGEVVYCTFTNTKATKLTVIKQVVNNNGGSATAGAWTMNVDATNPSDDSFPGSAGTTITLDPGAYGVTESGGPSGYALQSSVGCAGTITVGQHLVCTLVNNDVAPQLTVVKHVVNDDGGTRTASSFTMNVTGTNVSDDSFAGAEAPGTTVTLNAGSYSVDEGEHGGYAKTASADCTGTIAIGQSKTCTITNNDIAPQLTVVKHVVNDDGGTRTASSFTMNVTGTNVSDDSFAGAEAPGTTVTLNAGSYSVDEGEHGGYAKTASADCTGTIAIGQSKTCTITNNDIAPQLTVVKHVVNDDGGTRTASSFTMNVTGTNVSDDSFAGAEAPGTTVTLNAGSYSVDEGEHGGYAKTVSADCTGTIAIGQSKTCTITNNDIAAELTVIKHVVNKGGSDASAGDFTMNVTGTNVSDSSFDGAEAPGTTVSLDAGSYSVDESGGPADYTKSLSAACAGTIALGESKTCTITNRRDTGTIEVVKNLVPASDDGTFDLLVDNQVEKAGASNGEGTGQVEVATGDHAVSEAGALSHYVSAISCKLGETTVAQGAGGGPLTVAVAKDEHVVCTITNTRKPHVVIRKVLDPAEPGNETEFAFSSDLPAGGGVEADGGFALAHGEQVDAEVAPGAYAVAENNPTGAGYKLLALSCEESTSNSTTSLGNRSASIQADPGETVTCTFRNRRVTAQAVVIKTGSEFAYHGDTVTYQFAVTATGNSPLSDVHVTDDHCKDVSATPVNKVNDDGDASLDPIGADGVNPEQWIYNCSMQVSGDHAADEEDPIVNTATVTAKDELGRVVTDVDQHSTNLLHPSVSIDKTGPATALAGSRIEYTLVVGNTGDMPFAEALVVLTDDLCEAPPALVSKNGDGSPGTLDPGESWTYTCTVQSAADQNVVHNVASVTATDQNARMATASDSADTALARQEVLPARVDPGSARLRGPSGCPTARSVRATVSGRQIQSVSFFLDGHRIRTVTKPDTHGRWLVTMYPRRLSYGQHRVRARIQFTAASATPVRNLRLTFARCRPPVIRPKFTG